MPKGNGPTTLKVAVTKSPRREKWNAEETSLFSFVAVAKHHYILLVIMRVTIEKNENTDVTLF